MRKSLVVLLVLIIIFALGGCSSSSITGTYKRLKDQESVFVFEESEKGKGTFVEYFRGERMTEEYVRNEWEIIDGILILNEGEERFKIYEDCIIRLEENSDEPEDFKLIAPKGDNFDYEISGFKFNVDGTYSLLALPYPEGEYYRKGNIIYLSFPWQGKEEFEPYFYIYDNDHIIDTHYVYTK